MINSPTGSGHLPTRSFENSQDAYSSAIADQIAPAGFNAFTAFFEPAVNTPPPKPKRHQVLTAGQIAQQRISTRAWMDANREAYNAQRRDKRAALKECGLQDIPSRDVLAHESKPVTTASRRFAAA